MQPQREQSSGVVVAVVVVVVGGLVGLAGWILAPHPLQLGAAFE